MTTVSDGLHDKRLLLTASIAVALLAFVAASPTLRFGFVAEDSDHVAHVAADAGFVPRSFVSDWFHGLQGNGGFYRPAAVVLFAADHALWSDAPVGYHLTNTLLHVLNSVLTFFVALTVLRRWDHAFEAAFFSALLFAVWARHSEALAFVAARTDLLGMTGALVALLTFSRWLHARRWPWFVISIACTVMALLSKENQIVLPILLVLLHWLEARSFPWKTALLGTALVTGYLGLRIVLLGAIDKPYLWAVGTRAVELAPGQFGPTAALQNAVKGILSMILPPVLFRFPPFSGIRRCFYATSDVGSILILGIVLTAFLAVVWKGWRFTALRSEYVFLVAAVVLAALPAIPLRFPLLDIFEERQLYFPSVFFIILCVLAVQAVIRSERWTRLILASLVIAQLVAYQWSLNEWETASRISRSLESAVAASLRAADSTRQSIVFLDLPGMYRGVPLIATPRMLFLRSGGWPFHNLRPEDISEGIRWRQESATGDRHVEWVLTDGALRGTISDGSPAFVGAVFQDSTGTYLPMLAATNPADLIFQPRDTFCNFFHQGVDVTIGSNGRRTPLLLTYANGRFVPVIQ